jgi:tetratricopeptide (TPR) repeat protein
VPQQVVVARVTPESSRYPSKAKQGPNCRTRFQQAMAKDPNYARAHAGLADSYALMSSYYSAPQDELIPKARAAAPKALQIDDGLAEAHTSLAVIAQNYDWDWQTAEKEYRRAIQLDPNYATAHTLTRGRHRPRTSARQHCSGFPRVRAGGVGGIDRW